MSREDEIVWLKYDRIFAQLVGLGAYYSLVKYTRDGHDYEVQIETNEIEFIEDWAIDYDTDD